MFTPSLVCFSWYDIFYISTFGVVPRMFILYLCSLPVVRLLFIFVVVAILFLIITIYLFLLFSLAFSLRLFNGLVFKLFFVYLCYTALAITCCVLPLPLSLPFVFRILKGFGAPLFYKLYKITFVQYSHILFCCFLLVPFLFFSQPNTIKQLL